MDGCVFLRSCTWVPPTATSKVCCGRGRRSLHVLSRVQVFAITLSLSTFSPVFWTCPYPTVCVDVCVCVLKRLCGCYLPFAVGCESLRVGSLPLRRRLRSCLCQLIPCVPMSCFLTCALGSLRWSWNSKIERMVLPFPDGWIDGWSSDVSLGSRGSRNR